MCCHTALLPLLQGHSSWSAAIKDWYNEESQYNYNNAAFSSGTGHFTQMVSTASFSQAAHCRLADQSWLQAMPCHVAGHGRPE